ncbi:hypothetical protein LOK49_LG10G01104 [Camellia lanceoleosa]|uniref:Uncharacterized protein n=1 Tax=Camellia lanceoleosa TaxID=1840588 RepID=A0ACC0GCZ3_9ERIC|nr:hypothetical protein LOK49_LG10G01104 [Camellia lanceoleosa]
MQRNHHGVAIFRPNIGEDQQSTNELIAAHGLFIRFLEAVDVMQQVERLLIRDRHAFVSVGARLASEHCLPVMRADDVKSVVALINEFGYDGIPQPIYPDAPVLLEQPNREEAQKSLRGKPIYIKLQNRFHLLRDYLSLSLADLIHTHRRRFLIIASNRHHKGGRGWRWWCLLKKRTRDEISRISTN